jgi:hypothetical protein
LKLRKCFVTGIWNIRTKGILSIRDWNCYAQYRIPSRKGFKTKQQKGSYTSERATFNDRQRITVNRFTVACKQDKSLPNIIFHRHRSRRLMYKFTQGLQRWVKAKSCRIYYRPKWLDQTFPHIQVRECSETSRYLPLNGLQFLRWFDSYTLNLELRRKQTVCMILKSPCRPTELNSNESRTSRI